MEAQIKILDQSLKENKNKNLTMKKQKDLVRT
jgi:hypothetical protein